MLSRATWTCAIENNREYDSAFEEEVSMAYRFLVDEAACINCGICMDLCPVRCLDMTRPTGEGEIGAELAGGFTEEQARREASRCLRCDLAYRCPTIHTMTNET